MSYLGTFDGFTTSRLAIYAAQLGLNTTGNNVANINTTGYTRQVLDQVSLKTGGKDRYASQFDLRAGTGVLCTSISQIRDPYLDIRYRTEMSSVGAEDAKLAGLKDLSAILDEVGDGENDGDGIINAQISDFLSMLEKLNTYSGQEEYDTLARASADALTTLFNSYSKKLETLYDNSVKSFKQDIEQVNEILTNIRDLNSAIRKSDIHGDKALELRDERNLLIDELSKYMKIDVLYSEEDLGGGQTVEKLTIKLGNANPDNEVESDSATLVDGSYAVKLLMPDTVAKINPKYDPSVEIENPDPTNPDHIAAFKYLDKDGNGTDKESEAEQVENTNFDLTLSKLLDKYSRVWEETSTTMKEVAAAVEPKPDPVEEDDGKGAHVITDVSYVERDGKWYEITTVTQQSIKVPLDDNDLYGSLQSSREMLTESGEFASAGTINGVDESAAIKRGIPYYQKSLDLLARKFAETFNEANKGCVFNENGNYVDKTGAEIEMKKDNGESLGTISRVNGLTERQEAFLKLKGITLDEYLKDNGGKFIGGNLFSIRGDTDEAGETEGAEGITAGNISISESWSTGATRIVTTFQELYGGEVDNSTQCDNVQHMITLLNTKLTYNPQDLDPDAKSDHLVDGTFHEMLNNMCSTLADDQRSTNVKLNTYYQAAVELDTGRDNVAGVDLNDETMNMMQYQKALTAAYRLMTTLDEALERLINNTGIVGR